MTRYHLINGEKVAFTAAEETARDAEEAAWTAKQTELAKTLYQRKRTGEDATSTEDTQIVRDKIAKSQGKLKFHIHEIRQDQDNELNIYLQFD